MITKTRIAVIAAVLVGSASAALADNSQFDVNIYRPGIPGNAADAFALSPTNPNSGTARPFTAAEKGSFDRAQGSAE